MPGLSALLNEPETQGPETPPPDTQPQGRGFAGLLQSPPPDTQGRGLAGLLQPSAPAPPPPPAIKIAAPEGYNPFSLAPKPPTPTAKVEPEPLTLGQRILASPWLAPVETAARAYQEGTLRPVREALSGITHGVVGGEGGPIAPTLVQKVPGLEPQTVMEPPRTLTPEQRKLLTTGDPAAGFGGGGMTEEELAAIEKGGPRRSYVFETGQFIGWAVPGRILGILGEPLSRLIGPTVGRVVGEELAGRIVATAAGQRFIPGPLTNIASIGGQGVAYGTLQSIADRHDELAKMSLGDAARTIAADAGVTAQQFMTYGAAFEGLALVVRGGRLSKPQAQKLAAAAEPTATPEAQPVAAEPPAVYGQPSTA